MSRKSGAEDQSSFVDNEYKVAIDDSLKLKISSTDVVPTVPVMSASVSVPVLSASTATGNISGTQHVVLADASSAEMGLTLPAAAEFIGRCYTVKKVDVSANAVLLSASSGEYVDGAAFKTIDSHNEAVTVVSDGLQYHVIGHFTGSDLT